MEANRPSKIYQGHSYLHDIIAVVKQGRLTLDKLRTNVVCCCGHMFPLFPIHPLHFYFPTTRRTHQENIPRSACSSDIEPWPRRTSPFCSAAFSHSRPSASGACVRACLCLIARRTSRLFIVTSCWVACVRTIARIVYLADWAIKLARCCAHTSDPDACACTSLSASCCPTSVRWRHLRLLPQCVVCAICAFIPSY